MLMFIWLIVVFPTQFVLAVYMLACLSKHDPRYSKRWWRFALTTYALFTFWGASWLDRWWLPLLSIVLMGIWFRVARQRATDYNHHRRYGGEEEVLG